MLHCDDTQMAEISSLYKKHQQFHRVFDSTETSQADAQHILAQQGLNIRNLDDLGNGWSVRWSKKNSHAPDHRGCSRRILLQW